MAGQSQRFTLNQEDLKSWGKGLAIYGAPVLLVFLVELQAGSSISHAMYVVYAYALQQAIGLLKKYIGE